MGHHHARFRCRTIPTAVKPAMLTDWGRRGMRALSQGALPGPKALGAPLLPRVCDKVTGWRTVAQLWALALLSSRRGCGVSPLRPLLRPSTASCTCAHVCSAWPALRAPKSCLPRISVSPTSRTRDVSVLTWGISSFSIVRLLRAHDARVTVSFPCLEPLGLLGFPPWQPGRLWPSRLQRGWMRPVPGFTRRPSPLSHRSLN